MKIGTPKEIFDGENRVAMTPDSATALKKLGHECVIEAGAGLRAGFLDEAYAAAGVEVVADAKALFAAADVIAKVRPPSDAEVAMLRPDQTLISFFYPGSNEELMKKAADTGATVIAMDMVPRISRAQKMDALSSMANIAGYKAVSTADWSAVFAFQGENGCVNNDKNTIKFCVDHFFVNDFDAADLAPGRRLEEVEETHERASACEDRLATVQDHNRRLKDVLAQLKSL